MDDVRCMMDDVRCMKADGRWMMWLISPIRLMGLIGIICLMGSCRQGEDRIVYRDSRRWVEKTVAVVAPLNDSIMKTRLERTAEWMMGNLHKAQLYDTLCVELKLE
jgi:hypothetical protein